MVLAFPLSAQVSTRVSDEAASASHKLSPAEQNSELRQLRLAEAARRRDEQQITALRAESKLIAAEKLSQQLLNSQRNQQLQLEYMTRRAHLQSLLSLLLFVCLTLTLALAWSLWRINIVRRHQALEDPLTGLRNRRFLEPFMEHETERLRRAGHSSLVLVLDIDLFKSVNDRWGHEVGDSALVQFCEVLRGCMRNSDVISRWGGEEFLIICPQSAESDAENICNRIRQRLLKTPISVPSGEAFHLTVSIGAALFAPSTQKEHWESARARADQALYFVKRNGRDNWSMATPAGEPPPATHPAAV